MCNCLLYKSPDIFDPPKIMETLSRLVLMTIVARRPPHEKAAWNGSDGYLPIINVEDDDTEAARDTQTGGDREYSSNFGLEDLNFMILLAVQSVFVLCVEGAIIWKGFEGGDFDVWSWLSEFASPGLLVLFSVSFSALLLRAVGALTKFGDLGFQTAALIMATFCTIAVCTGVISVKEGKGAWEVVGGAVLMWLLFLIGFWTTVFRWRRHYIARKSERKDTQQDSSEALVRDI
ncbi:hypothetical protein Cob_v013006 [Colletotrichum orbiculare MAFF 240422]|uniref:Uncharacterized protein n=1 Tax=Colletotrichum orbiculare (strain 104-T / ATCC 96160 / CBS 514.97 / LARS 414 / MAFF 240422) TaxID=1213857 RepID=A0A484F7F0_COLOR|nr:hypothetical protein Cob_v013006 [Colletotrichum orbiculare MAFF 240422]